MSKKDCLVLRHELFIATALIGAHANIAEQGPSSGFRQRDVRFLVELFSNWVESSLGAAILEVQNTQISRYLEDLCAEGYLRRSNRGTHPQYRLTRTGLLELLSRLVNRSYQAERECFLFLYYFVSTYKPRLNDLVRMEGRQYPPALRLELEALVDERALLDRELGVARTELRKLEERVLDAERTSALTDKLLTEGVALQSVIDQVERLYPYELNSRKPLSELFHEIPPQYRAWELQTGNRRRAALLWQPAKVLLQSYVAQLERLKACSGEP